MNGAEVSRYVKSLACELGFDVCRVTRAEPIGRAGYLRKWLDDGRAGSMHYLHQHFKQRVDPGALFKGARSVIVVAQSYYRAAPPAREGPDGDRGRVACYAWGDDYHEVIRSRLHALAERMHADVPEAFDYRACVDTAPLLEREVAAAAGIGWIGKNTMVLRERLGSYFFLGALVTTLDIAPDERLPDRCGSCTACLDACPTGALTAPYEMDASRCISYLTIEHRGAISQALQARMGEWIFGCDVCQQVCPHNRHASVATEPRFAIRSPGPRPPLDAILAWTIEDYRHELRGSAMKRVKLEMLQRNARIARENIAREPGLRARPDGDSNLGD